MKTIQCRILELYIQYLFKYKLNLVKLKTEKYLYVYIKLLYIKDLKNLISM